MSTAFEIAIRQGCRFSETSFPLQDVNTKTNEITFTIKRGLRHTTALVPALKPLLAKMKKEGRKMTYEMPPQKSAQLAPLFSAHRSSASFVPLHARNRHNSTGTRRGSRATGNAVYRTCDSRGSSDISEAETRRSFAVHGCAKSSRARLTTVALVLKSGWLIRNCRTHRIVVLRPQNLQPAFFIIPMDQAQYPISRAKCFGNASVSSRSEILSPSILPNPTRTTDFRQYFSLGDRFALPGVETFQCQCRQ